MVEEAAALEHEGEVVTPRDFFVALYEHLECDGVIMYGPKGGPFKSVKLSELGAWDPPTDVDVYFRLCPIEKAPKSTRKRGEQVRSVALPFLWIDIDVGKEGKNGKRYFETREEAIRWVKTYLPYTFIVGSGTGLHAYCVLSDPVYITDQASFERAYLLSQRFQQWCRDLCPYDLDSTHDLARVLRIPGSYHGAVTDDDGRVLGPETPVQILETGSGTMDTSTVLALPVSKRQSRAPGSPSADGEIVLDPNCKIDMNLLIQIASINATFWATWTGQRDPAGDKTPSGLRFSMISFLSSMKLDRQTIANITIRYLLDQRGLRPDQIKLDRPNVWLAEMAKCAVENFSSDDIDEMVKTQSVDSQVQAAAALMEFPDPTVLVGVSRFKVMDSDSQTRAGVFRLHIKDDDNGEVIKVQLKNPLSRGECRREIFEQAGIALPHYSSKSAQNANRKWEQAIQLAWRAAEVMEPVQSGAAEMLLATIKACVNAGDLALSLEDSKETGNPFKDGNTYVIPTLQLNARARTQYPELRSSREIHLAVNELRRVGVEKKEQMHRGVRMACLVVPSHLVEE